MQNNTKRTRRGKFSSLVESKWLKRRICLKKKNNETNESIRAAN
jgi:hypothetical protein